MALTINDFNAISNGSYNVGQIKLNDDGTGLVKVNNHVWKTSKNNVLLSAEENRAVREELVRAFVNNHVDPDRIKYIRAVLLDGGRATRSLGRDFVKHLISQVGSGRTLDDAFVTSMKEAETKLLNRNVFVRGARAELPRGLMTSTCKEAYETYASEALDLEATKAHDAIVQLVRSTEVVDRITATVNAVNGIRHLLSADPRIADKGKIDKELVQLGAEFYNRHKPLVDQGVTDGAQLLAACFERRIREIYADHKVPDEVAKDHFARIFPNPPHFANVAENLRLDFLSISTGKVFGLQPFQVDANFRMIHKRIMDELSGIVDRLPRAEFSAESKMTAKHHIAEIAGTGSDDLTERMAQLMQITKNLPNGQDIDVNIVIASRFDTFVTQDVRRVFHGLPEGEQIAQMLVCELHRLGMGI